MKASVTIVPTKSELPISSCKRIACQAKLFHRLAWQFSYPDKSEALRLVSPGTVQEYRILLGAITPDCSRMNREAEALLDFIATSSEKNNAFALRLEYTRLFDGSDAPVSPHGASWVKNQTLSSRRYGEEYSVEQFYQSIGLVRDAAVQDRADHIVCELDFISYVFASEARAWEEGDAMNAREWHDIGRRFMEGHLRHLALGFSESVRKHSNNRFYVFAADALEGTVKSFG